MKIREILPESWWQDLDPGFLSMMGYTQETQQEEATDLASSVSTDVKDIKSNR